MDGRRHIAIDGFARAYRDGVTVPLRNRQLTTGERASLGQTPTSGRGFNAGSGNGCNPPVTATRP
eukprot:1990775-Karenia_brevis.AAC.1